MNSNEELVLTGAKENNLKDLDIRFSHDSLIAITGLSGSGKTTLAFDTIYAEGGRRYIETFSPYTRQFLDRLSKPDLENISGVRPALALEQQNRINSSRSTVGTATEINDYIKVVWSLLSELTCPNCDVRISRGTVSNTADSIKEFSKGHDDLSLITFKIKVIGKASIQAIIETLLFQGFLRYFNVKKNTVEKIEALIDLNEIPENIFIVVDRFKSLKTATDSRLFSSIRQSFTFGQGSLSCILVKKKKSETSVLQFSEGYRCNSCQENFTAPKPSLFSYNSPLGACESCKGFGKILEIDPELVIPDRSKTIKKGAIQCWSTPSTTRIFSKLKKFCEELSIPLDIPWNELKEKQKKAILEGEKNSLGYKGVFNYFERLKKKRHKMHVRIMLSRFRSEFDCSDCSATRLKKEALLYTINEKTLPEIWKLPLDKALDFFEEISKKITKEDPTRIPLRQAISRLGYLVEIGLHYLTLNRQSRTLSGGESQRVNLTSILGAELVNTTLVLDEPTIGLHGSDTQKLIKTLHQLKDRGNSVFVVEHDQEVIASADEIIDIGPLAGSEGGDVVFKGSLQKLKKDNSSLTGSYLDKVNTLKKDEKEKKGQQYLEVKGATAQNLKNLDVKIPLEKFVVITGVSGSGKSSLVNECLYKGYQRTLKGENAKTLGNEKNSPVKSISGIQQLDEIIYIDQSPIGKSPRSNAATYTKAWDLIRQCLASTKQAEELALTKSAFSFNIDGGRCLTCKGAGQVRIEMQFLSNVFVECEECGGCRFQEQVRAIKYYGKSVVDFLEMTLEDVVIFFKKIDDTKKTKEIIAILTPLQLLGLGYLKLGQPLNTVSGGEAQRIKLASYLNAKFKKKCLFILDEPTTGLHPYNIDQLMNTFSLLREKGHSILCIEHNFDVISQADWIIDLGPGGGTHGGEIIASGTPNQFVKRYKTKSLTAKLLAESLKPKKTTKIKKNPSKKRVKKNSVISIEGARHNNLKDISLEIPTGVFNVVTGVSGSGKSSVAFQILFAEGQRRYIDCLSPYARQYIKQLSRADVDRVSGIPPTIAISQRTSPPLGISTLATTTEIYQYLRLLYSKIGIQHCTKDGNPISNMSIDSLIEIIIKRFQGKNILIFAPAVQGRKGYYNDLFQRALRAEITQARIDDEMVSLTADMRLERHKLHWISLLVSSIKITKSKKEFLKQAVEQALVLGAGAIEICKDDAYGESEILSVDRLCSECGTGYLPLDPQDFSFRSRRGVCLHCEGRGKIKEGRHSFKECPKCKGARIKKLGRNVFVNGLSIFELTAMTAKELLAFITKIKLNKREEIIAKGIVDELKSRLEVIVSVGLDYLSLDRDASSVSGGESQRLRLACALGSPLSGVCYILDEPSIGLHSSDHQMLMKTLKTLKDRGNTLIVVEHDEDTIRAADNVIDFGPGGGAIGGNMVFQGSPKELEKNKSSQTGAALRERSKTKGVIEKNKIDKKAPCLSITDACANNLKDIDVNIIHKKLTVIAGVSGAGKSSLVHNCIVPAIVEAFEGEKEREKFYPKKWSSFNGIGEIQKYIEIDQSSIGKTPTSTPASYLGIFNDIRKIYAMTPDAKAQGWKANHFSFNTGKGKCQVCSGRGVIKVPMSFLPDASTKCEACNGLRYNEQTLEIEYQGISIGELLKKTFNEARQILTNHRKIVRSVDYILELGLGYLTLGQPSHTLSGGEAQRLKIAKELGAREACNNIYVLDEPTVGLHMNDVEKLYKVLSKLTQLGNTVIVIEHNVDIIKKADYLIELGPNAGDKGGKLLFSGSPYELLKSKIRTPTKSFL